MRFSRLRIQNFRNLVDIDVRLGNNAVFLGVNGCGKSNLFFALRLLLDPTLPDSARYLRADDFSDSLQRPLNPSSRITISLDITDFNNEPSVSGILTDYLVTGGDTGATARLNYSYRVRQGYSGQKDSDYDFILFGGNNEQNRLSPQLRKRIALEVAPALRDAESDLNNWRHSPLRPLLSSQIASITAEEKSDIGEAVSTAMNKARALNQISALETEISAALDNLLGDLSNTTYRLQNTPIDADKLLRALRIYIDGGSRGLGDASLGFTNVLYIALKIMHAKQAHKEHDRSVTLLSIEEPEAHLHPHAQRSVFRSLLAGRIPHASKTETPQNDFSIFLTTHSPHIASVTPLRDLILLKTHNQRTSACSLAEIALSEQEVSDLERYLDVSRSELFFAKRVILVEGDVELFMIPAIAKALDIDLDEHGISVLSVMGTNFTPYANLLQHIGVPFSIVTDRDPHVRTTGRARIEKILNRLGHSTWADENSMFSLAESLGIFTNDDTFECDMFHSNRDLMCRVMRDLCDNTAATERLESWRTGSPWNRSSFLSDAEGIGKGRIAQRLASEVVNGTDIVATLPSYLANSVRFVTRQ